MRLASMIGTVGAILIGLLSSNSFAFDCGDPISKQDTKGSLRLELIVENFDRDVENELSFDNLPPLNEEYTEGMDQTVFMARIHLPLDRAGKLFFDLGIMDDDDADDTPFVVGIGTQIPVYDKQGLRLDFTANAHWVPEYDFEETHAKGNLRYTLSGDKGYYELGAGMLISGELKLDRQSRIIPYGGLMLSVLRGSGDIEALVDGYRIADGDLDLTEDEIPVAVLGLSFLLQKSFSFRLEARVIGDSSLSAAMGIAF